MQKTKVYKQKTTKTSKFVNCLGELDYEKCIWKAYESVKSSASRKDFIRTFLDNSHLKELEFLFCGKRVLKSDLSSKLYKILYEAIHNIIFEDGEFIGLRHSILPGISSSSIVDIPVKYQKNEWRVIPRKERPKDSVHFGFDTFIMLDEIKRICEEKTFHRGLDLCCGSGALTYSLSNYVDEVIGVDSNIRAIEMARFGYNLNNKAPTFIWDDVSLFRSKDLFDIIVSNPPYVPVPDGFYFPDYGNGGNDGNKIVNAIFERLDKLLSDTGQALVMFFATDETLILNQEQFNGFITSVRVCFEYSRDKFLRTKGKMYSNSIKLSNYFDGIDTIKLCIAELKRAK